MRYSETMKKLSLSLNVLKLKRVGTTLLFALIVTLGTMLPFSYVSQAQAGFPLYSWGNTNALGRTHGTTPPQVPHNRPGRVGTAYWISSATSAGGNLGVRADGRLVHFTATAGTTLIGTQSNWVQVSARGDNPNRVALNNQGQIFQFRGTTPPTAQIPGSQGQTWVYVASGNNEVFAINDQGQLWSMGVGVNLPPPMPTASLQTLGRGPDTDYNTFARVTVPPNNPACDLYWVSVAVGAQFAVGLTDCNRIWSWGGDVWSGDHLKLGRPTTGTDPFGNPAVHGSIPGRVGRSDTCAGLNENWIAVGALNNVGMAINEEGHLYTWGQPGTTETISPDSRLGRPHGNSPPYVHHGTPGRVSLLRENGTPASFISIHGGSAHAIAVTDELRLYSWGLNTNGQLGLGHDNPVPAQPHFIIQSHGFMDASRGGGSASFMLIRTIPAEAAFTINKDLRKLQGATLPSNMTFEFNVTPHSFNGNANQINQLPTIPSANRSVTITSTSESTTASGITTKEDYTDLFRGVSFAQAGTFAWMISEVENSSQVNTTPPSNLRVNYSEARYEVRVTVVQQGASFVIDGIALLRHVTADGVVLSPPQTVSNHGNELTFTNTFQRWSSGTNTCAGALSVSKEIDGDFVDPLTPFLFNVTLTGTALCAAGTEFSARLYGPNNNFIRTESFTVNVPRNNVPILDGQTLVFPYLPVGLEWVVEEQAAEGFTARVERVVNGTTLATITNPHPELLLSTGTHTITAENLRNDVAFTNIHFITPPMGLFLASGVPYAVVGAAGLMLATLLVLRVRVSKKIEDKPAMY